MNTGAIIFLVAISAFLVVEVIGLVSTIIKKKKQKQNTLAETSQKEVNADNDNHD